MKEKNLQPEVLQKKVDYLNNLKLKLITMSKENTLTPMLIIEALRATKKRSIVPNKEQYPIVVETTIWTDKEIEKLKKMLLK